MRKVNPALVPFTS